MQFLPTDKEATTISMLEAGILERIGDGVTPNVTLTADDELSVLPRPRLQRGLRRKILQKLCFNT